jgi:hypothetical protein
MWSLFIAVAGNALHENMVYIFPDFFNPFRAFVFRTMMVYICQLYVSFCCFLSTDDLQQFAVVSFC